MYAHTFLHLRLWEFPTHNLFFLFSLLHTCARVCASHVFSSTLFVFCSVRHFVCLYIVLRILQVFMHSSHLDVSFLNHFTTNICCLFVKCFLLSLFYIFLHILMLHAVFSFIHMVFLLF